MTSYLNSRAMLVDFSVSQWTARKVDKAKSDQVNDDANAVRTASHVSKRLILSDTLAKIGNLKNRAYEYHREHTSPWLDTGPRILSVAMYDEYVAEMEKFEAEFHPLVRTLVANYPEYVDRARHQLGDLFSENDYPTASRIGSKFGWRITYLPIPDTGDFRVAIGNDAMAKIKASAEQTIKASMANAVRDVFERAHDRVAAMVEKLNDYKPAANPGDKTQGIFRDSLVENIRDLVNLMPALNVTGDVRITKLATDMAALCKHDAEVLRASDTIRADVAAQAATIVQAVSDFMA